MLRGHVGLDDVASQLLADPGGGHLLHPLHLTMTGVDDDGVAQANVAGGVTVTGEGDHRVGGVLDLDQNPTKARWAVAAAGPLVLLAIALLGQATTLAVGLRLGAGLVGRLGALVVGLGLDRVVGLAEALGEEISHVAQTILDGALGLGLGAQELGGQGGAVDVQGGDQDLAMLGAPVGRGDAGPTGLGVLLQVARHQDLALQLGVQQDRLQAPPDRSRQGLEGSHRTPGHNVDDPDAVVPAGDLGHGQAEPDRASGEGWQGWGLHLTLGLEATQLHQLILHGDLARPDRQDLSEPLVQLGLVDRTVEVRDDDEGEGAATRQAGQDTLGPLGLDLVAAEHVSGGDPVHEYLLAALRPGDDREAVVAEAEGGQLAETVGPVEAGVIAVGRLAHPDVVGDDFVGEARAVVQHGHGRRVRRHGVFAGGPEAHGDLWHHAAAGGRVEAVDHQLGDHERGFTVEVGGHGPDQTIRGLEDEQVLAHYFPPFLLKALMARLNWPMRSVKAPGYSNPRTTDCLKSSITRTGRRLCAALRLGSVWGRLASRLMLRRTMAIRLSRSSSPVKGSVSSSGSTWTTGGGRD